ncbi:MAG: hypothetical protein U5L09_04725 [Bacteroidales bacterium]|nr:hypothetical protein [Bacteroidales bacterium]
MKPNPKQSKSAAPNAGSENQKRKKGNGFNDIAGMDELKETLYHDVIRALEEKELYEEYGLTIPNGILLYGPTMVAESHFLLRN